MGINMKILYKNFMTTFILSLIWIMYMMSISISISIGPIIVLPSLLGFGRIWFLFFDSYEGG